MRDMRERPRPDNLPAVQERAVNRACQPALASACERIQALSQCHHAAINSSTVHPELPSDSAPKHFTPVLFCSFCRCCREREDRAAEKEHTRRCEVIRSLAEPSEALQKIMLDDYLLDDECLAMYRSPNWLGDENIEFYWEQIARELNSIGKALDILFVPPAVVMLAHFLTAEQLREPDNFGKNLGDISKMELVIMAINNAESTQGGGTHWGCLVYCRYLNQFRYYDSMLGTNSRLARAFAEKFAVALGAEGAELVEEVDAPQQRNSFDCGVFTMIVGEIVARRFHATGCMPTTADIAAMVLSESRVSETRRAAAKQASIVRSRVAT